MELYPRLVTLGLLMSLCLAVCSAQDSECVQNPPGDMIVQVDQEYGCATFQCYNQTTNITQYDQYDYSGWILADLTVVSAPYDDGKVKVIEDGDSFNLTVYNVSRDDIGYYHCMLTYRPTDEYYVIRFGLNMRGPFFITGWELYKMNTIVGCSAFGGFLVLCLILYLLVHYRYREPGTGDDKEYIQPYLGTVEDPAPKYAPADDTKFADPNIHYKKALEAASDFETISVGKQSAASGSGASGSGSGASGSGSGASGSGSGSGSGSDNVRQRNVAASDVTDGFENKAFDNDEIITTEL